MQLPLYWIDAFTDRVFAGNPAAVVPLESWPDDALLQQIAFENGLSETAFFVRSGDARFHLRWFTPAAEIDLCGHATLASAFVLFHEFGQRGELITFDSRSGPLSVAKRSPPLLRGQADRATPKCPPDRLELDFPSRPASAATAPTVLLNALGRPPDYVARSERMWLCVYPHADDVRALRPNHALWQGLDPGRIIVTAPGEDCDFVSRFFAPGVGVPEDPVTGSAHCTLMPYWVKRLGREKLHARQVSARGGELWCELARGGDTGSGDRVRMAGNAVLYLRGEISV